MSTSRALTAGPVAELSGAPFGSNAQTGRAPVAALNPSRLLTMAETIGNMGHWHWYPDTDAMIWSDAIWPMVGLNPAQHVPSLALVLACAHPDDRAEMQRQLREAAANGTDFEFDVRLVHGDGTMRTVIAKGLPELRDNKVEAMFGVLTDVTEAFDAIRAIREQHEMLDLAAELAQLGHWVWNSDQRTMSFCSDELARIHGMSLEAFRGRFQRPEDFAAAVVIEQREQYLRAIRAALSRLEPYEVEYRLMAGAGGIKEIREIGHPLFDDDAGVKRFIVTVQDITDAKRRENELKQAKAAVESQAEALRRSELKFRDIIEGSVQGIVILRDFQPVFANQTYARMVGMAKPEDVIAHGDMRPLLAPNSEMQSAWTATLLEEIDGKAYRTALRTLNRGVIWVDAVGRRIEWEGKPAHLVTVIDVTERHIADEELQAKTDELQQLNLQKDKLFSIIAHDLKAPFNAVIGFADLLAARASTLAPDKIADYARIVRDSATSVHGLFDNLLTWAAFQLRDSAPRFAAVDLTDAVSEAIAPLLSLAAEKDVRIVNAIGETAPNVQVLADEDLLRIVVRNLVSNGIKFCHAGGEVRLAALADPAGDGMACMSISDTGVGMEAEEIANLFRLDRTVSVPGTRGERGTGLGLYLCQDIILRHGGSIGAEAVPGKGSTFHVTLPRAIAQQPA